MVRAFRLPVVSERPATRGECLDGPRPCPYVTCRFHLLVSVARDGRLLASRDFDENDEESIAAALYEMTETCALDVADMGGATFERVSDMLGLPAQKSEQIQVQALARIRDLGVDFEEREHPEDSYARYVNMGADELSEIAALLKARQRKASK